MSTKGTVLISGINGYIASRTAETFLEAGYSVRGTVRSLSSANGLQDVLRDYVKVGKLSVVEVPDITKSGAFDEAVKGVHAIVHMASPVSLSFTDPDPIITAAREGTRTILASAINHAGPQLETVLLTSSVAAIMGNHEPDYLYTEHDWNTVAEAEVARLGKNTPGQHIYAASKTAAERAFWEFKKQFEPGWKMGAVNPAWVVGPPLVLPESPETLNETTRPIYDVLAGKDIELGGPVRPSVDVRDVARMVEWMVSNSEKADGERFIAASGQAGNSQTVADVLRNQYPERKDVIKAGNPGESYVKGFGFAKDGRKFDNTKTTKTMGIHWIGYEKMVLDTAKAFEKYL